ncbi:MAG: cyclase family protein [Bryobacteraceae bacterium]
MGSTARPRNCPRHPEHGGDALGGYGGAGGFATSDGIHGDAEPGIRRHLAVFFDSFKNQEARDPSNTFNAVSMNCSPNEIRWPPHRLALAGRLRVNIAVAAGSEPDLKESSGIVSTAGAASACGAPIELLEYRTESGVATFAARNGYQGLSSSTSSSADPGLDKIAFMRTLLPIGALAVLISCSTPAPPPSEPQPFRIDPARLVDLSYTYDAGTIYWPNAEGFRHRKDAWADTPNGYWYAAGEFTSAEHGGTHLDSPIHFARGKRTVEQIPVSDLIAPAAVIDITAKAGNDRDYRATPDDITAWERDHGPIAAGTIVVFRTGWGTRWPDKLQYLGSDTPGDVTNLHFPGLSREAAELLVQRRIHGVAIDTASLDYGPSQDFIVHQVLNGADIYGLENLANAEKLPATGATLIALPVKIGEGSGAPVRVVAVLP